MLSSSLLRPLELPLRPLSSLSLSSPLPPASADCARENFFSSCEESCGRETLSLCAMNSLTPSCTDTPAEAPVAAVATECSSPASASASSMADEAKRRDATRRAVAVLLLPLVLLQYYSHPIQYS